MTIASHTAPVGLCCHLLGNGQNTIMVRTNVSFSGRGKKMEQLEFETRSVYSSKSRACLLVGWQTPTYQYDITIICVLQTSQQMQSVTVVHFSAIRQNLSIREAVDWWGWCFRPGWKAGWRDVCGPCRMSASLSSDRLSERLVAPPVWF